MFYFCTEGKGRLESEKSERVTKCKEYFLGAVLTLYVASAVSFPDGIPVIIFRYGRPLSPNLIYLLPILKPHSLHRVVIQLNSTLTCPDQEAK